LNIVEPTREGLRAAADALLRDEIVAYPTETVYGLGANPFSPAALVRLWQIKDRDKLNPVLLIIGSLAQLDQVVAGLSPRAQSCIRRFWPGPLTLVLPKAPNVPDELTAGRPKVAVRFPSHPVAQQLALLAGMPITSTSANRSGQPAITSSKHVTLPGLALLIDAGDLPPSLPSTVYDPDNDTIYRPGPIAEADLRG
jgi:L-threonylcarbamoyladenylate synthase